MSYAVTAFDLQDRESMLHVTPLGYGLRVIVNEKSLNFEKSTSCVLSVLLIIYGSIEV